MRNMKTELAGDWDCMQVPMASKGIALCRSNHAKIESALRSACRQDDMKWADQRLLRSVLHREFTGDRRFPMWVMIWHDEWPVVSRALRTAGDDAAPYQLFMRQLKKGGVLL